MKGYPLHSYPISLDLVDEDHGNARMTIATPPSLPWQQLWLSVGASMDALSGAYSAATKLLVNSDGPCAADEPFLSNDLRVVRLRYGSPVDIELIVGFATAFSLVWAVASGAIITTIKVQEWIEKRKELKDEMRRRHLEIEKLQLEVEEKKEQIARGPSVPQLPAVSSDLTKLQLIIIKQLFFFGDILAGKEDDIWIPPFSEYSGLERQPRLWDDEAEVRYGSFERDANGRIWFYPAALRPHIIGG